MGTHHVSLTEAKQNLGELVKRTAYGNDRFILEFRGKPRAALVNFEDLERLQFSEGAPGCQREALDRLSQLGKRISAGSGKALQSVSDLEEIREERVDRLSGVC